MRVLRKSKIKHRNKLPELVPDGGIVCELGVASGDYSKILLGADHIAKVVSVDMWAGDRGHDDAQYMEATNKLKPYGDRSHVVRASFVDAADLFDDESFDMVYLDGYAHEGNASGALEAWLPKVKIGGYISGHDYDKRHWMSSVDTVTAFARLYELDISQTRERDPHAGVFPSWYAQKTKRVKTVPPRVPRVLPATTGPLVVFHVAQMGHWREICDYIFDAMQTSGLLDASKLYLTVGGEEDFDIPAGAEILTRGIIREFEFPGIQAVHDLAQTTTEPICYCHTKGASKATPKSRRYGDRWMRYLTWGVIERWREHIAALATHDVSGVEYTRLARHLIEPCGTPAVFAGNFWWGRAEYLAKLPYPVASENRFYCEGYCFRHEPTVSNIHSLAGGDANNFHKVLRAKNFSFRESARKEEIKIGVTLLCRDEADILPAWIEHYKPIADYIIATDNHSDDDSPAILDAAGIEVIDEQGRGYRQVEWCKIMQDRCIEEGCTHVINVDADEFWNADLRKLAQMCKGDVGAVVVPWRSYVPTVADRDDESDPRKRMKYFLPSNEDALSRFGKVLYRPEGAIVEMGNHRVSYNDGKITLPAQEGHVAHYPDRHYEQYKRKHIITGESLKMGNHHRTIGCHRRKVYADYIARGEVAFVEAWNATLRKDLRGLRLDKNDSTEDVLRGLIGKSVCLVGNATPARPVGHLIDSYDVVIRMNNYRLDGYADLIGKKTTHRSTSAWENIEPRGNIPEFSPFTSDAPESLHSAAYASRTSKPFLWAANRCEVPPEIQHPTTGLATIILCGACGLQVDLYGFDGFKTAHYWDQKNSYMSHHTNEMGYILSLDYVRMMIEGGS